MAASGICSPTRRARRCGWSSTPPTSRTVTAWRWPVPEFASAFPGCSTCSPMPAIRARSPLPPRHASVCGSRSSGGRATPRASTCSPARWGQTAPVPSGMEPQARLGDRAHLRHPTVALSDRPQPSPGQGLRAADRDHDRHGGPRHHPDAHAPAGKPLISKRNFSDGLLQKRAFGVDVHGSAVSPERALQVQLIMYILNQ